MAEAVVDGSPMSRFFCHKCSVEIERLLPNFTCPRCASGFIEELESSSNEGSSGMDMNSEDLSDGDIDILTLNPSQRSDRDRDLIDMIMGLSNTYANQQLSTSQPSGGGNRNYVLGSRRRSNWSRTPQDGRRTSSNRRRQESLQVPIENFIQDFIFNLSGAASLGNSVGQDAQSTSVFNVRLFLGNPGDYVWGRDGLDAIVTQLLNQMDGTGPPPLSRNQIDEIPTTTITQSQVDIKLQCSVCWEDFKLSEPVRQLPCQHVYHAPCIVPWLELHGTCPICRQNLGDQNQAEANQDTGANIAGSTLAGSSFAALFRAANEANRTGQPISRTSSTSSSTSSE
ncbi:E3 ubiquitin-protein ligase Iruka isoform X2 [Temnothorax nylanderi]|uniref:E3 ubiquitin-protein ligase Iruka isoform X2 n=1 Tax=Temnothorax nylanderi TaxID=102681 RepID=UPI003A874AD7